jgi:hypothetical protein
MYVVWWPWGRFVAKVVVLCVCSGCEGQSTTQYPLEVGQRPIGEAVDGRVV